MLRKEANGSCLKLLLNNFEFLLGVPQAHRGSRRPRGPLPSHPEGRRQRPSQGFGRWPWLGLCWAGFNKSHLLMGRSQGHRVRLEVHPEQLRCQHQPHALRHLGLLGVAVDQEGHPEEHRSSLDHCRCHVLLQDLGAWLVHPQLWPWSLVRPCLQGLGYKRPWPCHTPNVCWYDCVDGQILNKY